MNSDNRRKGNSRIWKAFIRSLVRTRFPAILVPVILCVAANLFAAGPMVTFKHLTTDDGLSAHYINFIFQDSTGFIWIGTSDGLNRYDGYTFSVFRHESENPDSLSNSSVNAVCEDKNGILWFGTQSGLNRFDRQTNKFKRYVFDKRLLYNPIWSVYEDSTGTLWICARIGGLYRFDRKTETFVNYRHDPDDPGSLSSNHAETIFEDSLGNLWIGTSGGLNRFDRGTESFTSFRHDPADPRSLSHNMVRSICEDRAGFLWVATDGGLNRLVVPNGKGYEDAVFERFLHDENDSESLSHNAVRFVREGSRGALWVGTFGGGVNLLAPPGTEGKRKAVFAHFRHSPNDPHSLLDDGVLSFMEDRSGGLWIGTGYGISKTDFRLAKFPHYKHDPDDPHSVGSNLINQIYEDATGHIWFTLTGGGIDKLDPKTGIFRHYLPDKNNPNSLGFIHTSCVYEDHAGILWIGAWGGGLDRFDPGSGNFSHYRHDSENSNSISGNLVIAVTEDSENRLWVGAYEGGLNRFDRAKGTFTRYLHDPDNPHSLGDNRVVDIHKDTAGILWICLIGGLDRFDPATDRFVHYRHNPDDPNSLGHATVKLMYEDSNGNLWIGTEGGLDRLDRKSGIFHHYTVKDGLPNNSIQGILEDDQGNLWISTNKGVSRLGLSPQGEKTGAFRNFDKLDGLQGSGFRLKSSCKSRTGEMYFGGNNGFNRFQPDSIQDNPHIPPVVMTDFQLFNKSVPVGGDSVLQKHIAYTKEIVLTHDQSKFSFEFAALNYTATSKNRYAYRLTPFDEHWIPAAGDKRFATYTNLDPGEYVFRVKGSNNDGVWNEEGAAVHIVILPPWWDLWWFKVAVLALIAGLISGGYFLRVGALNAQRRELERLVAERAASLADREQTLAAILSASPIGIGLVRDRNLGWANEEMYRMLGYTEKELLGRSAETLYPTTVEYDEAREMLYAPLAKGEIGHIETRWQRKDGGVFDCEVQLCALDRSDLSKGQIAVARDISERKQMEAALRASESLLNETGAMAHVGGWEIILATGHLRWTAEVYRIHEVDPSYQPTPEAGLDFYAPEARPVIQKALRNVAEQGESFDLELPFITAKGTRCWVRVIGKALEEKGRIVKIAGTFQDITLRWQAEYALRESEERFRLSFENASVGVCLVGMDGRLLRVNRMMCDIFGYKREEMEQMTVNDITHPDFINISPEFIKRAASGDGTQAEMEKLYFHKQGRLVWGLVTSALVKDAEGKPLCFISHVQDITVRKAAEEELKIAKAAAEAANQAKSRFLANMSHELRTPLNAILGFSELMERSRRVSPEDAENLQIIRRSGKHLLTLINQVLDFSKIEAGQMVLNEEKTDLHDLLDDMIDTFRLNAEDKGVVLINEHGPNVPRSIRTDRLKLRQVLLNLLSNAVKFTATGNITLRTGVENLGRERVRLLFEVADTGPGISAEETAVLFEAFGQAESGRETQEGTGLGLAISRDFVRLMGGDISVKSEVGKGSVFAFHIDADAAANHDATVAGINENGITIEPGQPEYRILIVDDHPENRQLLTAILTPFGFKLREAENGKEALKIYETWRPRLVFMDIQMPVMDGYEAIRRIRELDGRNETKIIAVTASVFESDQIATWEARCDDFLRKPFNQSDVLEMMRTHLGLRPACSKARSDSSRSGRSRRNAASLTETLADVPGSLLDEMEHACKIADMDRITKQIGQIHALSPDLAKTLHALANDFEYAKILKLIRIRENAAGQPFDPDRSKGN